MFTLTLSPSLSLTHLLLNSQEANQSTSLTHTNAHKRPHSLTHALSLPPLAHSHIHTFSSIISPTNQLHSLTRMHTSFLPLALFLSFSPSSIISPTNQL
jgi:hypothetical protein